MFSIQCKCKHNAITITPFEQSLKACSHGTIATPIYLLQLKCRMGFSVIVTMNSYIELNPTEPICCDNKIAVAIVPCEHVLRYSQPK